MAIQTQQELIDRANEIRTETAEKANTNSRVGGLLRDFAQSALFDYQVLTNQNLARIQDLGNISGNIEIDLLEGTLIKANLTGSVTLTFINLPVIDTETAFTLRFSGIHQINLPVGTLFANGEAPVPEGTLYDIPCSISSTGVVIVYGIINNIS